jgi:hypothetical protein
VGLPGAPRLEALRRRRTVRRQMRQLYSGAWREVLIKAKKSQHHFRQVDLGEDRIDRLLVKLNAFRLAVRMHATVLLGEPVGLSAPEDFEAQRLALGAMRERGLVDAVLLDAARVVNAEGEAAIRVGVGDNGEGAYLALDSNDETFAVGATGPDLQPTVWERRWCIKRASSGYRRGDKRFLRVERHRVINGVGVIEQEAYTGERLGSDVLVDLATLERVPLETAIGERAAMLEPISETGVGVPLITRLVADIERGEPAWLLSPEHLDLVDATAAAVSRIDRVLEIHGQPRMRFPDDGIVKDGTVKLSEEEAFIDPEGRVGYVQLSAEFDALSRYADRSLRWLLTDLQISPALLGLKLGDGAAPETVEKLRLESTTTLSRGKQSATHVGPALGRAFTAASQIESRLPGRGFAVAPVRCEVRPTLPKDRADLAAELAEQRREGQISEDEMLRQLWGDEQAGPMARAIEADRQREAQRNAASLGAELGFAPTGGPPNPASPTSPSDPSDPTSPADPAAGVGAGDDGGGGRVTCSWIKLLIVALIAAGVEAGMPTNTPDPTDRLGLEVARLYDAAAADIAALTAREIERLDADPSRRSSTFRIARASRLAEQIDARRRALGVQRDRVLAGLGEDVIARAVRTVDDELNDLGIGPANQPRGGAVGFDLLDERPVSVVARDTLARIDLGNLDSGIEQTAQTARTLFRTLSESPASVRARDDGVAGGVDAQVNTGIARALVSGDRTLADRAVRELFRDPNDPVGQSVRKLGGKVITVGQREMTVRDYADTVARTRMAEATIAASRDRMTSNGVRLAQITGSNSSNFCTAFVGLVVSLTGSAEVVDGVTYRPIEQLPNGGPPFHPRCSKSASAFDPTLSGEGRLASAKRAEQVYQRRAATGRLMDDVR